jgi:endoglucanase
LDLIRTLVRDAPDESQRSNSGRALGILAASTSSGANAVQWVQNSGNDQQWQLVAVGSNYELVDRNSGLALSVSGGSTSDGAQVVQQAYTGATSQLWSLVLVSS